MSEWSFLQECRAFEWDSHNTVKIWKKHRVTPQECEEVFFNWPLVVAEDVKHSKVEKRYFLLGQTDGGRRLFVVFTVRGDKIRVITTRDISRKERKAYEAHQEEAPEIQE